MDVTWYPIGYRYHLIAVERSIGSESRQSLTKQIVSFFFKPHAANELKLGTCRVYHDSETRANYGVLVANLVRKATY
jgi:hypothetical protein